MGTAVASVSVVLASTALAASAVSTAKLNALTSIACGEETIEIVAANVPQFTTFTLSAPNRVVVDVVDAVLSGVAGKPPINHALVTSLKAIAFENAASPVIRIEIGLLEDAEATVRLEDHRLIVKPVLTAAGQARVAQNLAAAKQQLAREASAKAQIELEQKRALAAAAEQERKQLVAQAARETALAKEAEKAEQDKVKLAAKQAAEQAAAEEKAAAIEAKRAALLQKAETERQRAADRAAQDAAKAETRKLAESEKVRAAQALQEERSAQVEAAKKVAEEKRLAASNARAEAAERQRQKQQEAKAAQVQRELELARAKTAQLEATAEAKAEAAAQKVARLEATANAKREATEREAARVEAVAAAKRQDAEQRALAAASQHAAEQQRKLSERMAADSGSKTGAPQLQAQPSEVAVAEASSIASPLAKPSESLAMEQPVAATAQAKTKAMVSSVSAPSPGVSARERLENALALTPSPDELRARTARMTFLGFHQENGSGQVLLRTSSPVKASVGENASGEVVVTLQNCQISIPNNQRLIDASFFDTAVSLVKPQSIEDDRVRVSISLKSRVGYRMTQTGNEVLVAFEAP